MPTPPRADKKPTPLQRHGISWTDDYAWLRDPNWQAVIKDPSLLKADIREYLEAENRYTEAVMEPTKKLQNHLFAELKGRIAEDDRSVPEHDGEYAYYTRYFSGKQHPVFCRYPIRAPQQEEVLFDGNLEVRGFDFFKVGDCEHSPDHRYFAYGVDTHGGEAYTLRIRDLQTGQDLSEEILNVYGGELVWTADSRGLVYVKINTDYRPDRVYLHHLHTVPEKDQLLYQENDSGFFLNVDITRSRRFIIINAHDHTTSEVRLLDATAPKSSPLLVQPREPNLEYTVEERNGELWILTNADNCENYKLCKTSLEQPQRAHWQDVAIPSPGVLFTEIMVAQDFIARLEIKQALPQLIIMSPDGTEHTLSFPESAYALDIELTYEYDSPLLRFIYSSMTTPCSTYDYDTRDRTRTLLKQDIVPSGHDPNNYCTERLYAATKDGEKIPITLLYKQSDTPTKPLLLYGYGAYGHSVPAQFSPHRFSLVDRGFIYAVAHIRGGMENGHAWYRTGKHQHKNNTFADFITAADYLIENHYTCRGNIAIHGGSAGGMLIGAVLNQEPELFKAAIANVPFVDVLNTMCDDTLPLTPPEWNEWGNPIQSAEDFNLIRSYSPYDNVKAQAYPNILVTAGVSDPRVTYWESAKWVAKLRAMKKDQHRLLLKTNMSAGHAGAAGRFDYLLELALMYAFILDVFEPPKQ